MAETSNSTAPAVCFVVPSGVRSGEARQAYLHLSMVRHAGGRLVVAGDPESWFARQCRASEVPVIPIGAGLGGQRALQHQLKTHPVDVVHGFGFAGSQAAVKLGRSHDSASVVSLYDCDDLKPARKATHVLVADSACLAAAESVGVGSDRVTLHGFAVPDHSRLGAHTRETARTALRLEPDHVAVFVPGPLCADMGQDLLLSALDAGTDARLRVVLTGSRDTEYAREMHLRAAQMTTTVGGVVGQLADPSLLLGFDLCAAPVRAGHASHHVLASLNAGLPVLTHPVGAMADLIEDGESGMFALRETAAGWQRVLERALADPGELARMGECARLGFRSRCGMRASARRYLAILESLVVEPDTA